MWVDNKISLDVIHCVLITDLFLYIRWLQFPHITLIFLWALGWQDSGECVSGSVCRLHGAEKSAEALQHELSASVRRFNPVTRQETNKGRMQYRAPSVCSTTGWLLWDRATHTPILRLFGMAEQALHSSSIMPDGTCLGLGQVKSGFTHWHTWESKSKDVRERRSLLVKGLFFQFWCYFLSLTCMFARCSM